jgi:hypothetical protein
MARLRGGKEGPRSEADRAQVHRRRITGFCKGAARPEGARVILAAAPDGKAMGSRINGLGTGRQAGHRWRERAALRAVTSLPLLLTRKSIDRHPGVRK